MLKSDDLINLMVHDLEPGIQMRFKKLGNFIFKVLFNMFLFWAIYFSLIAASKVFSMEKAILMVLIMIFLAVSQRAASFQLFKVEK